MRFWTAECRVNENGFDSLKEEDEKQKNNELEAQLGFRLDDDGDDDLHSKIKSTTEQFNRSALKGQAYAFYVVPYSLNMKEGQMFLAVFEMNGSFSRKDAARFMRMFGAELKHFHKEETTLSKLNRPILRASRRDLCKNSEEIYGDLSLSWYDDSSPSQYLGENLLVPYSKEEALGKATLFCQRETLEEEMNRIFSGEKRPFCGHPVHYLYRTDDEELRREIPRILLGALYTQNRLPNRSYYYLNVSEEDAVNPALLEKIYTMADGSAVILRFDMDTQTNTNTAAAELGIVEDYSKVIARHRSDVLTVCVIPRSCNALKESLFEHLAGTTLVEMEELMVDKTRAAAMLSEMARERNLTPNDSLYKDLLEKTYLVPELKTMFGEWQQKYLKENIYTQYNQVPAAVAKLVKKEENGDAYQELQEMIGIREARTMIERAIKFFKAQKLFAMKGMKTEQPSMHMIFTGQPGTAKTTVARLFARIMRDNHLLTRGHMVEVGRSDLVGKYVGWTAPTIKRKFEMASGGVLFIDEAYSLVDGHENSFGDEAINTIVQEMENRRADMVVIFAGYPDKMEEFMRRNPGLRSRIAFHIHFPNYSAEELCDIARLMAKKMQLELTPEAMEKLKALTQEASRDEDFGNGRYIRNILEQTRMNQASRLVDMDLEQVSAQDVRTLIAEDIPEPLLSAEPLKPCIGFI